MSGQSLRVSSEFQATPSDQSFLWVPHADRGATAVDVGRGGQPGGRRGSAALHVHDGAAEVTVDGGESVFVLIVDVVVAASDEYLTPEEGDAAYVNLRKDYLLNYVINDLHRCYA